MSATATVIERIDQLEQRLSTEMHAAHEEMVRIFYTNIYGETPAESVDRLIREETETTSS